MKKKLFFKLFIFAVIGAFVTVTSCKDYDDDINRLDTDLAAVESSLQAAVTELNALESQIAAAATDSEVAAAVAAAKTEAINTAKTEATNLINALKGGYTGTLKDLNDKIVAQAALITVLQGNVAALGPDLDAAEVQIAANKAAIALQKAILDKYFNTASPDDIPTALADIRDDLAAAEVDIDALSDRIDDIDTALNVLDFAKINNMITEVTFDFEGDDFIRDLGAFDLNFTTTPARVTYTFDAGVSNPISFVTGQRQTTAGIKIRVKVSPANADLSKMLDKIKLIRSDANAQINNYVHASAAVRATPLLTRATPTVTGLWDITFDLPTSANLTAFRNLIQSPAPVKQYLFALAIENTVDAAEDAEDRFVISDFAIAMSADDINPVYNSANYPNDLTFQARGTTVSSWTNHTAIQNRYGILDPVSGTNLTDKAWNTVWNTTPVPDGNDMRAGQPLLNVEVAKEFNVKLTNSNIYAYYVTLDKDYAVESNPSEINAWNAYQYEGLNTVYKANEVAKLKINSADAAGDIIGFRVIAVNWDGTKVDFDGKAFYVGVGASASTALAFQQEITAPVAAGVAVPSTIVAFTPPAGIAINSEEFAMTIGHNVALTFANIQRLDANNNVVFSWATTKKLQIIGVIPADLQENTTYTGTLTLKNTAGIPVHISTLTLAKVLPTADLGITYKSNILHDVNGQQVVYGYPLPSRYYDVTTALNVPSTMTNLTVTNNSTYPAASLPTWNQASTPVNYGLTAAIIPAAEIGVPYLPAAAPGHGKIYNLTLSRNYGPVKYNATSPAGTGVNYNLNWTGTPALKVEFRSFVQDLADWKYTNAGTVVEGNFPALKYGADLTGYAFTNITALPPAGPRVDLTNLPPIAGSTTGLQDDRSFTVTGVRVLTGATFNIANEYFDPTINSTTIDFKAVITSTPAGPVPTKLEVTLTDNFGHAYTFVIPKVFNMTLN
jgi:hypothetical protein